MTGKGHTASTPPAFGGGGELHLCDSRAGAASPEHDELVAALLRWFSRNQRRLPWRQDYAPYAVWISEIMLQQTQMDRAAEYFIRWMQRFPSVQSVSEAHIDDLLKAWEGLGYYSRVRNLHKAAKEIMAAHNGRIPDSLPALLALPGVGKYTAGAVLAIAYNQPHAAVDANVERVFARLFDVGAPVKSAVSAGFIQDMAETLLPDGQAREYAQALMELGALVCRKKPLCDACPVQRFCQAHRLGIVHERPVPGRKVHYSALEIITGLLIVNGHIFIQKRLDSGVWAGFWEFPGGRLEAGETPQQGIAREFLEETGFAVEVHTRLGIVRHAYTRYRIVMHCFILDISTAKAPARTPDLQGFPVPTLTAATEYRWVLPDELDAFTMPAGHRKLADAWLPQIRDAAGFGAQKNEGAAHA
ncbi:A/G-specific adenine glycosylase [Desulfovibrio sp. OttesenSCG-928-G15]|nr:A/G-specific adenine glycosylase [Desulfovibrio sp. OttesenSCG-928-G15]